LTRGGARRNVLSSNGIVELEDTIPMRTSSATRRPRAMAPAALLCLSIAGCGQAPSDRVATGPAARTEPSATPAPAQTPAKTARPPAQANAQTQPRFVVLATLADPSVASTAREVILSAGILTDLATELNGLVAMPQTVLVDVTTCGKPDAFYDSTEHRITICEEFVDNLGETFLPHLSSDRAGQALIYVAALTFLHEAGNALIQELSLPIEGSAATAADQFAAYILAGNPDADPATVAGAAWLGPALAARPEELTLDWDGQSLEPARFVSLNCWVLGSNPDEYAWMVDPMIVPADRAKGCPSEWAKLERSLSTLLAPHLR
jgi:hypothetical protein